MVIVPGVGTANKTLQRAWKLDLASVFSGPTCTPSVTNSSLRSATLEFDSDETQALMSDRLKDSAG